MNSRNNSRSPRFGEVVAKEGRWILREAENFFLFTAKVNKHDGLGIALHEVTEILYGCVDRADELVEEILDRTRQELMLKGTAQKGGAA